MLDKTDGPFDLSLGLGVIGTAQSGDETVMTCKVQEVFVPLRVGRSLHAMDHDLFHVVVEDLTGIASKIPERVEMALDKRGNVGRQGELDVPHAGIAEDHGKTGEASRLAVKVHRPAVAPVNLSLSPRFGLITVDSGRNDVRANGSEVLLDLGVLPGVAALKDLPIDPSSREVRIVVQALNDVLAVGVQLGGFRCAVLGGW